MTTLQLYIQNRHLTLATDTAVAAGDRNAVRLLVEADPTWSGYTLAAVLWRDGNTAAAISVPLCSAHCCLIPPLMLASSGTLHMAIVGRDSEGRTKTTTAIRYLIRTGAPDAEDAVLANVADGTATPDHVLAGVIFYAGQSEAQTGAIETYGEGDLVIDDAVDNLTVTADFSAGDQTVTAEGGAPMYSVTVQKPDTLAAAYIAEGAELEFATLIRAYHVS